ncbi:zinc finger and BTB domain containing 25 S homeolog isoform X2 [Xenopus laevis]|nr:zinc finger and BTB domain containing 25 S homeolog isoform X2 [Xenopus laevis]
MDSSCHSQVLLQQLNMQREFGFLCDCTVAIGDVYFKAHRAVLAAFSNYFKMIFIHQSSECIKIQPTDIQPDIFSYLLHVMYTGRCPKQSVDHVRLDEGIRFLHANLLTLSANEPIKMFSAETVQSSNLYGIQISTAQKPEKEKITLRENPTTTMMSSPEEERPQLQLSLAIGLEGVSQEQQSSNFPVQFGSSLKSLEEFQKTTVFIKEETCDPEASRSPPEDEESTFTKTSNKNHSCHYCGEKFQSRGILRDHLHIHVSESLPFGVPASILESDDLGEVRPILENIENTESFRLGNILLNKSEESCQNSSQPEQLQLNQLSLLSKEADPIELNCNFSLLRKRKLSCTLCGHRFLSRSQLLEHLYAHKIKPHKYGRYQRIGRSQTLQTYSNSLTENTQSQLETSQEFLEELESSVPKGQAEAVLVD